MNGDSGAARVQSGQQYEAMVLRVVAAVASDHEIVGRSQHHGPYKAESDIQVILPNGHRILIHAKRSARERWKQADRDSMALEKYYGFGGTTNILVCEDREVGATFISGMIWSNVSGLGAKLTAILEERR